MKRSTLSFLIVLLSGAPALSTPPSAPFAIDARLSADSGVIEVRLLADGSDIQIAVTGLRGLKLASPISHHAKRVRRGEVLQLPIRFELQAGKKAGIVSVQATARFRGLRQAAVRTFTVGDPRDLLAPKRTRVTPEGEKIRPLPARTRR